MTFFRLVLTAMFACIIGGCEPSIREASLETVHPNWGFNGEATLISIQGDGLLPGINARGGVIEGYDREFKAFLSLDGDYYLDGVRLVGSDLIEASVPPGMPIGWYDLSVTTPSGQTVSIEDAYEVTDSRADHLQVTSEQTSPRVNEIAVVQISLRDPGGSIVTEPLPVTIEALGTRESSETYQFYVDGLPDGFIESNGHVVSGTLGASGEAFVGFTTQVPDDIWITVSGEIPGRGPISSTQLVSFRAGEVAELLIDLPNDGFSSTAGESFDITLRLVDEIGNTVSGIYATVALTERCSGGTLQTVETFVDDATVSIAPTKACGDNAIEGFGVVEGIGISGVSSGFSVAGAPLSGLAVHVTPDTIRAGVDSANLVVNGVDEWGNLTSDPIGELVVSGESGPLTDSSSSGLYACSETGAGSALCTASIFSASPALSLEVASSLGPEGVGNAIAVLPGAADVIDVSIATTETVAGESFGVAIQVLDRFDNAVLLTSADIDGLVFFDSDDSIECVHVASDEDSRTYSFQCVMTAAGDDKSLRIVSTTFGATGTDRPIHVRPGGLRSVEVTVEDGIESGGMEAGDTIWVAFEGVDQWGNRVDEDTEIEVEDISGSSEPGTILLSDGLAIDLFSLETAMQGNSLWAHNELGLLGGSATFDVRAGPSVGVHVELAEPWAWVGESSAVQLSVVDSFGNPTSDGSVEVTLESMSALGGSTIVEVSGTTVVDFGFDSSGVGDQLIVTGDSLDGSSSLFDVAENCIDGPSVEVSLSGVTDGRICLDGDGRVERNVALVSTSAVYANVQFDATPVYRGPPTDFSLSWEAPHRSLLRSLVMDGEGCGIEDTQVLYVGDVDVPVGPISVVPALETLVAGASGADAETEVMVSALECTGDSAADGTVMIRTEMGDPTAAEETSLVASGGGLLLSLDSGGSGRFYWSAASVEEGGISVVHVGGGNGAAYGWSFVEIEGDSLAPNVVSITPSGTTSEVLTSASIVFTEPMYRFSSTSDMRDWVKVLTPAGDIHAWDELVWGPESRTIELIFDEPIDASTGEWTVVLTDDLRDAAGNRLPDTVRHRFGSLPHEIGSAFGCKPNVGWFFPDGDDGFGFEADGVSVHVVTDRSAEWWHVGVFDETTSMIRHSTSFRGGLLSGAVSWDGRDQGGRVVGEGTYQMSITPVDEFHNLGTPCVVSVGVMHRFDEVVGL